MKPTKVFKRFRKLTLRQKRQFVIAARLLIERDKKAATLKGPWPVPAGFSIVSGMLAAEEATNTLRKKALAEHFLHGKSRIVRKAAKRAGVKVHNIKVAKTPADLTGYQHLNDADYDDQGNLRPGVDHD